MIEESRAREIARDDAQRNYRDLSPFIVSSTLAAGVWRVDYELTQAGLQGGGPHYAIDADTGRIIEKRYEQ